MKHNVITWDTCSNWHVNCSGSKEVGPLLLLEPMSHDMATNKQYCSVTWHRNCSLTGRDEKIQDRDDMGYAHLSAQYTERDIYIYIYIYIYIWNYDMSSTPARSCSHMSTWDQMELSVDVLICLGDLPRQCFNLSKYYSINELSCVIFYCIISNHTI